MSKPTGKTCKVCGGGIVSENLKEPIDVRPLLAEMVRGPGVSRGRVTAQRIAIICFCGDCGLVYHPPVILRKK